MSRPFPYPFKHLPEKTGGKKLPFAAVPSRPALDGEMAFRLPGRVISRASDPAPLPYTPLFPMPGQPEPEHAKPGFPQHPEQPILSAIHFPARSGSLRFPSVGNRLLPRNREKEWENG
ncbi:hypothetical protein C1I94_05980 [Akkermansia muciniphila]|nr:hypothetical protein C1I94_05980 [Akkermansia muciniphila]